MLPVQLRHTSAVYRFCPGEFSTGIVAQTEAEFCARGFPDLIGSLRQKGRAGDKTAATLAGIVQTATPHALHRSAVHLVRATRPTMRERLLEMAIPRTYIYGEDSLPGLDHAVFTRHGINVSSIPRAGHLMTLENPRSVAKAVEKALGDTV